MEVVRSKVAIVVATFGDESWRDLATERAVPSAEVQNYRTRDGVHHIPPVFQNHEPEGTLASSRDAAIRQAYGHGAEFIVCLDADDELAPGYLAAMMMAHPSEAELLVPQVQYVRGRRREEPSFPREVPYQDGNWLVIGSMFSTLAYFEVGGFEEWPMYEDWALFARMQKVGVRPRRVADAVYIAHRRPRSRNHYGGTYAMRRTHNEIRRAIFPELYESGEMVASEKGYDSWVLRGDG